MPLLTVFLEPLGLGKGRGSLFAVHRVQQVYLFLLFEKGQLIGRVQGNLLFIHHIHQFRNQLCQTDIAKNLVFTLTYLLCQNLAGLLPKIVPNLGTIFFTRSASLSFHGIQLHFISKCPFTWEQAFSLQVAVNHNDRGGIIIQIPNNDRHGLLFCQLTGSVPPVSGYQLITALRVRSGNGRNQNAILFDTVSGLHHGSVILDFEWVVPKGMQFR